MPIVIYIATVINSSYSPNSSSTKVLVLNIDSTICYMLATSYTIYMLQVNLRVNHIDIDSFASAVWILKVILEWQILLADSC